MSRLETATTSLRSARMRARAPRLLAYSLVAILCIAGLRAILAGPAEPVVRPATGKGPRTDRPAEAMAEGFVRAYLTWDSVRPETREESLADYLPESLDADAGLIPPVGTDQDVDWTAVLGTRRGAHASEVTVVAHTTEGTVYVTVPVARDHDGFLYVAGYPALVGAPPIQRDPRVPRAEEVEDRGLRTVVARALINYLTGTRQNLYADLTPNAVVSLPAQAMRSAEINDITWVARDRVAVEATAQDERHGLWTLRYELEVRLRDRWYVRAIQGNPTHKGDS